MGVLTNLELQSAVRTGLGERTEKDALIVQGLNVAEKVIARKFEFNELRQDPVDDDLTASSNTYALSDLISTAGHESYTRIKTLFSLALIDGTSYYPLTALNGRKWEKSVPSHADTDTEGRPHIYTRYTDGKLLFYRTPDSGYTVRFSYSIWPVPIQHTSGVITVGGADGTPGEADATSELEDKDDLITAYATMWCYALMGNTEKAGFFFGIYNSQLTEVLKNVTQVDVENTKGKLSTGGSYESVSAGVGAKAGTSGWDATYSSMPHWD